jgi:hypothetical protein
MMNSRLKEVRDMDTRRAVRIGVLILGAATLAALGRGQATVKVVDGVKIITNGKRPVPPPGTATKLVLEDVYTLGGGESPDQDFSDISAVAVRPDGSIFVLDAKESLVKSFDATGKFLFSFGKKGQGPGEMNLPAGISISPENELIIEDAGNRRLAFFDLRGKFLRHLSAGTALGLSGILMDARGRIVARSVGMGEGGKIVLEVKIYDKDLKPVRTLVSVDFGSPLQKKINPFEGLSTLYALDSGGSLYLGARKGYQIRVIDLDGKVLRTIERDFDPVPIKKEDIEEKMKGAPAVGSVNMKDLIAIPDVYPPYANFIVCEDGRLIVRTFERGPEKAEVYWDVFDAEGRYVSRVPLKTELLLMRGGKAYGVEENEDGYKLLKCFRVRWEK